MAGTNAAVELESWDEMEIDESAATFAPRAVPVTEDRTIMKNVIAWAIDGKLKSLRGGANDEKEGDLFNELAKSGDFMAWTVLAYFDTLKKIAVADTVNFTVKTTLTQYLAALDGELPTAQANTVSETPTSRLLALFISFICLAKGNEARNNPTIQSPVSLENASIFRRYSAMVAGKNLPTANAVKAFIENLPRGCLEAGHAVLWANDKIAKKMIAWVLKSNPATEADKALVSQMKMVYGGAEMAFAKTAAEFLAGCDTHLKLLPQVVEDGERYLEVKEALEARHHEHYLHLRLLKHADADSIAPRAFPYLAGAAAYWTNRRHAAAAGAAVYIAPLMVRTEGYTVTEMDDASRTKISADMKLATATKLPARFAKTAGLKDDIVPQGYTAGTSGLAQLLTMLQTMQTGKPPGVP
ncbi:N-protein [Socyvirus heteroderae]|uniref:N-protein n=1 Tax=Socyvirus heteroderae TaxID=1034377 RepID=G0WXP8_9MONO|nr:N-protein [Socyvirus heteroderae]AEF56725.1 N-protein [Socyvirus heteroderae]